MNPKTKYETNSQSLCVDTSGLQEILQSGRKTAVEIGIQAEARVQMVGVFYGMIGKVKKYLDEVSE